MSCNTGIHPARSLQSAARRARDSQQRNTPTTRLRDVQGLVLPDNRRERLSLLTKEKARCSKQNTLPETHSYNLLHRS